MIQFPCRCGHLFRLADDEAGSSVQCPECSLLTDAPLLGELHAVADDGTFKLVERAAEPPRPITRLSELTHTFGKEREDEAGRIDLRLTPEEVASVGAPLPPKTAPPRYDPETGELIRPLELNEPIRKKPNPATIPFAKPALIYSTSAPIVASDTWRGTVAVLCSPVNVVVMTSVLAVQLAVFMICVFSIATGIMLVTVGTFVVQLLLIAHYGNVIDEVGVEERDDLPRLFRDLRLHEDIWSPLAGMLAGTLLCFAPSLICLMAALMPRDIFLRTSDVLLLLAWVVGFCIIMLSAMSEGFSKIDWPRQVVLPLFAIVLASIASFVPAGLCIAVDAGTPVRVAIAAALELPGLFLIPGVLLTMMTSGTILNIRPDRLLQTIRICGARYASPLLAWLIAAVTYGLGQTIVAMGVVRFVGGQKSQSWLDHTLIGYPLLCVGLIVMHFFCFELGMLYRMHHSKFPWVLQRHEPVNQRSRTAAIRAATNSRATRLSKK